MAQPREIHIDWTSWLSKKSKCWDEQEVLYMYATDDEVLYIGKAVGETVRQRYEAGDKKRVLRWIKNPKNVSKHWETKVGFITLTDRERFTIKRIEIAEGLLIFLESICYGRCRANVACTKSRKRQYRTGIQIINHGRYDPLNKTYPHPNVYG